MRHLWKYTIVLIFLCASVNNAQAKDHADSSHADDGHHVHKNHVAMFVGNTSQKRYKLNTFTLGLDYMHFFKHSDHFGVSVCTELLFGENPGWLICTPLVYKMNDQAWLRSGFGLELITGHDDEVHKMPLFRIGGGYDFHVGSLTLSPSMDLDLVREHVAMVVGLNIGFGY